MGEGLGCGDPPARSALYEALLEQVGLVDVLERVLLLRNHDRKRAEADGAAVELLADGRENPPVEPVEPLSVDFEQIQRGRGDPAVDRAGVAHLRVVANALEQPVGPARGPAAAAGDRLGPRLVDRRPEDAGAADHDRPELAGVVEVEPVRYAETVA